jgi:ornithine cyclodeaminase/alanine dehydrogenase-like protein (mu-crystallin family)
VTSALAARLVARADARSLLVIGAGVQGRAHAEMFRQLLDLDEVVIVSRNGNAARALAESLGVQHATSVEEAVRAADIVCACTHAESPVLRREWLRPARMSAPWVRRTDASSTMRRPRPACSS